MASIALTAAGSLIGGPVGAQIGNIIGSEIDRRILSKPKGREGPRLDDLSVQGSDYGTPIPRHYGTVRSAGTIIWSSGLKETAKRSGGKSSGGRTTTYSYSASFAVLIAGRPIADVGRIWADGKLLRGGAGDMQAGGRVRIHAGNERQTPDPLLQGALGLDLAPAHRGIAYAVFEDLELADFANRIPNLSFEVIADAGEADPAAILSDLGRSIGIDVETAPLMTGVTGFSASRNTDFGTLVGTLSLLSPIAVRASGDKLVFRADTDGDIVGINAGRLLPVEGGRRRDATRRNAPDELPSAITLSANDPARDFQPSLQRAHRPEGGRGGLQHLNLPASLTAAEAKRTVETYLDALWVRRTEAERRLPIGLAALEPGDVVQIGHGDGRASETWKVRSLELDFLSLRTALERQPLPVADLPSADAGVADLNVDIPQGETILRILDLPPIGEEPQTEIRVWLASSGTGAGWRRAEFLLSLDGGLSWTSVGIASTPTIMGSCVTTLGDADWSRWDELNAVEIDLLDDSALKNRARTSVLEGANLAQIGDELLQFTRAEEIGPRRWRLSGFLRGRRGTEAVVSAHAPCEPFTLLDRAALFPLDLPLSTLGTEILVKAVGPADPIPAAVPIALSIRGRALQPLSPVRLRVERAENGDLAIDWIRRSRLGFVWIDGTDVPLGEEQEQYRLRVTSGGRAAEYLTASPGFLYRAVAQIDDLDSLFAGGAIEVTQISGMTGPGHAARVDL
ncbi:MAG: phage tail protein [Pseudomonadota bacterium]